MFRDFLLLKFYSLHFDRKCSFMLRENISAYIKQITRVGFIFTLKIEYFARIFIIYLIFNIHYTWSLFIGHFKEKDLTFIQMITRQT